MLICDPCRPHSGVACTNKTHTTHSHNAMAAKWSNQFWSEHEIEREREFLHLHMVITHRIHYLFYLCTVCGCRAGILSFSDLCGFSMRKMCSHIVQLIKSCVHACLPVYMCVCVCACICEKERAQASC